MIGKQSNAELTDREREIVILTAEGLSIRGIAARLGLSEKTIKAHRTGIRKKLYPSIALITRYAIRQGWIAP